MKKKTYCFMFIFALSALMVWCNAYASHPAGDTVQTEKEIMKRAFGIQLPFIANEGQIHKDASFYAKTFGGTLYVTGKGEMVYSLPRISKVKKTDAVKKTAGDKKIDAWVLKENLLGAYKIHPKGMDKAKTHVSYFKGNDKKKWRSNISTYNCLSLGRVYDGIDLSLKAYGKNVEKIFTVYPAGRVSDIRLKIDGASSLKSNLDGELEVQTGLGPVRFSAPLAYQVIDGKRKIVNASYDVKGKTYGFRVDEYDRGKPLIIDPLLASTFIGGSNGDTGYSIALDSLNNVYITGYTDSTDFPTTSGAYDENGSYDVFVSKLNSDLTTLSASTFLGGGGYDTGYSITLDSSNNVYITGKTWSSDFPTTSGAYDETYNGEGDVFVSKLSSNLTTLSASTFLGGGVNYDIGYSITLDSSNNVYITGRTYSSDFPTTSGAYDTTYNGGTSDVFVSELNSDLTVLSASTFLGGGWTDSGNSITLDSSNNVYITGFTWSSDFPTTSGAYNETKSGVNDVFVSKLSSDLTVLSASTFLDGDDGSSGCSIALDSSNNVYIAGDTWSYFPTTSGAYDMTYNGASDVFVSKLNSDLTVLSASTFLGGAYQDYPNSITLDSSNNVYITGHTDSPDFPTTLGAYDEEYNTSNPFVSKLSSDLAVLTASTFLGSTGSANSITLDSSNNVYIAGETIDPDFPTTSGAYDETYNGEKDVFVSKLDGNLSAGATPPVVTSTTPANNATDVAIDTSITADFSTEMDPSTITTDTFLVNDGSVNIAGLVTYSGTTATFTPTTDLDYDTTYTATITTAAKDLAGTPLENDYSWSFSSSGSTPPSGGGGGSGGCFINTAAYY